MTDIPRRSLAAGAGLLVGALALRTEAQQKMEEAEQLASANKPDLRVQPLTLNPDKIPGLSAKLLTSHHDNNYAGAVKRLGAIEDQLVKFDFANAPSFQLSGLKREEHIAYNSTILHELYFASLGEMPTRPSGLFAEALSRDFGSLDRWRAEFGATAKALGGGSGWVILAYSARDKRLYNHWAADHAMAPAGSVPLLAIDMYEHAYAMDYGANAGAYVDAFLKIVKWPNAERLYREAMRV
jgi:Fe-Mn family superoxide dismutase